MTKSLIQILGQSYNQIRQIHEVDETIHGDQGVDAFWNVLFAIQKAISVLVVQSPEDRVIKLKVLKDLFESNYSGSDWKVNTAEMDELTRYQYEIINQLAAE